MWKSTPNPNVSKLKTIQTKIGKRLKCVCVCMYVCLADRRRLRKTFARGCTHVAKHSNVVPNIVPSVVPNIVPNVVPNIVPNAMPNVEPNVVQDPVPTILSLRLLSISPASHGQAPGTVHDTWCGTRVAGQAWRRMDLRSRCVGAAILMAQMTPVRIALLCSRRVGTADPLRGPYRRLGGKSVHSNAGARALRGCRPGGYAG